MTPLDAILVMMITIVVCLIMWKSQSENFSSHGSSSHGGMSSSASHAAPDEMLLASKLNSTEVGGSPQFANGAPISRIYNYGILYPKYDLEDLEGPSALEICKHGCVTQYHKGKIDGSGYDLCLNMCLQADM